MSISSIKLTSRSLIPDMDQHVKRMLKLIEEDADSFTKKVEIYYQKRPELINLVEDVYRMYRSLAERYDHVTGELRKNIPSDLQSQCSGITDLGSEPPSTMPSPGPSRRQSGHRAPGFDFFLGHNGGNESPTLESESEFDDSSSSSVIYYSGGMHGSNELEEKLKMQEEAAVNNVSDCSFKKSGGDEIARYEDQLRVARRKIQQSEEEIRRLKSLGDPNNNNNFIDQATEVHESIMNASGGDVFDSERRVLTLWEEHRITREKLQESEQEVARLRQEISTKAFSDLKMAPKEISLWKNKLDQEKAEVARYKIILANRDQEIKELKEAISNANKSLSQENQQLQAEIARMSNEISYLEDNVRQQVVSEIEQLKADIADKNDRIQELKVNLDVLVNEKDDLNMSIFELGRELTSKDDQIDQMSSHLHQLHVEHVDLIAAAEGARKAAVELRAKVKDLEREVEKKQQIIVQGAEEKREAIRQLCFSLEHYRNGYHRLREVVTGPKLTAS
ncbi:hypothetical protein C2S52_017066 [Perilla frutescens var. hirtella]|nr:hypothetical protein C2S52_017066 [Perilla frutescens var. hirtella]